MVHQSTVGTRRRRGVPVVPGTGSTSLRSTAARLPWRHGIDDLRAEIRDFLSSRRARITRRRRACRRTAATAGCKGLRREEVAMLAGVSVDYYIRMERGSLAGASESVLDALAGRCSSTRPNGTTCSRSPASRGAHGRDPRSRTAPTAVRPAIQQMLDAITDAPAWVRNGRHDIVAMNPLARALYSPVLADPRRPANTTRFVYLAGRGGP